MDLVDVPDVIFARADGEQACVGVVELRIFKRKKEKKGEQHWKKTNNMHEKHRWDNYHIGPNIR